jgi:hypothetical protein
LVQDLHSLNMIYKRSNNIESGINLCPNSLWVSKFTRIQIDKHGLYDNGPQFGFEDAFVTQYSMKNVIDFDSWCLDGSNIPPKSTTLQGALAICILVTMVHDLTRNLSDNISLKQILVYVNM